MLYMCLCKYKWWLSWGAVLPVSYVWNSGNEWVNVGTRAWLGVEMLSWFWGNFMELKRYSAELCGDLLYLIASKPVWKCGNMGRKSFTHLIGVWLLLKLCFQNDSFFNWISHTVVDWLSCWYYVCATFSGLLWKPENVAQLRAHIVKLCRALSEDLCRKVVTDVRVCLQEVVRQNDGRIEHVLH